MTHLESRQQDFHYYFLMQLPYYCKPQKRRNALLTEFDYPKLNPNPIIIEVIMRLEPIPKSEI